MLRNYLLIAWRNVRKQSFYSVINVLGLAIGVAACLMITLYVIDEVSYDRQHKNADRIYRVETTVKFAGNNFEMAYRPAPEASTLIHDFPEVEAAVRFHEGGSYLVRPAGTADNLQEQEVIWADSTFFDIFTVPVVEGNGRKALAQPGGIAISQRIARKYFPGVSPLGKELILDNNHHMHVEAVYADLPSTSHFHFDILISMQGDAPIAREARGTSFLSENFQEYILLKEHTDKKLLENKLPAYIAKYMGPEVAKNFGADFSFEKFTASGNKYDLHLIPLKDIHLRPDIKGDFEHAGNKTYVILMSIIAGFILIIGCINFMNLSTARSAGRAREVGVRKAMGSLRGHLVAQFLTESFLVTLFSFVIAIGVVFLLLPLFNDLAQKQLRLPLADLSFTGMVLLACVLISIFAGLYPSFFLSGFKPVNVLKGRVATGVKSGTIRGGLVVFQFIISIFLIIGALAINRQMHFIQTKNLGFKKDQVLIIHDGYALRPNNGTPFKNEVLKVGGIESGTMTGFVPIESNWAWRSNTSMWKVGTDPSTENMVSCQIWSVDYDYVKTYGMNITEGRDFSSEFPADSSGIILNQAAVKQLGLVGDIIGSSVNVFMNGPPSPENTVPLKVIGVMDDFHFTSMRSSIAPLSLVLGRSDGSFSFRFKPGHTAEVIESIAAIWKKLAPGQPFNYSFLDADFERMYDSEQRLGTIFTLFAGLAIAIACLGLFALTAFTAEQRTKEIGIRKTLGASMNSIVVLLSKDFARLIIIAFVVAAPLAWYAINWWLEGFTYKVIPGWQIYVAAGVSAFVLAIATMSFQSIKAASGDPVKALRSE